MSSRLRNLLIVLALAAVVGFLPGAGRGTEVLLALLSLTILAGIVWLGGRLYMEHRAELMDLGSRDRRLAYGAAGVCLFMVAAAPRLWETGPGALAWMLVVGAAAYGLFVVYRSARRYS